MMNKLVYKNYVKLSNIVMRLSDGTPAGKEHAILVNAHLDSTLPSPGAADDALAVGVMIECIRVFIHTPEWEPTHAIVFLFNNAEETLQDGSHLFATQHDIVSSVRAVINLEAAGSTGPELLFQATSNEMIEAYSHVPWPFGTVLANDVFSSGIILSDTDFRQFEQYRNLTGLDMAVVGDSYKYHTRKDLVEHIEPGVAQHMADNAFALLQFLSSSESPLPTMESPTPPSTVYFAILGRLFIWWSFDTAKKLYASTFLASIVLALSTSSRQQLALLPRATVGVVGAILGAMAGANFVAFVMAKVLDNGMAWYSREWLCIALYGPPALAGAILVQLLITLRVPPPSRLKLEYATMTSLHLFFASASLGLQWLGIGSAAHIYFLSVSSLAAMIYDSACKFFSPTDSNQVQFGSYFIGQFIPLTVGVEVAATLLDIFVPLTGRMGEVAPVEHIIASITAFLVFFVLPFSIPFSHRFGRRVASATILTLSLVTVFVMMVFSLPIWSPFDHMHQKRFFALHTENITSGEFSLHIAAADAAPGFKTLVDSIAENFGLPGANARANIMDDWNSDWDVLYPFSQFLTPYKVAIPAPDSYISPWAGRFKVTAVNDSLDVLQNTRSLTLQVDHPGLIWTVVAFDAHVLSWSLDDFPTPHQTRHHVKEASFYGVDTWTLDLVIQLPLNSTSSTGSFDDRGLVVNFIGIEERGMWPGKKAEREGPAMDLFEKIDKWLFDEMSDSVDAMFLGCVGGATIV